MKKIDKTSLIAVLAALFMSGVNAKEPAGVQKLAGGDEDADGFTGQVLLYWGV